MRYKENEFDYLDDNRQRNVLMIIGGVVLVIIIVVLCILIWNLAHSGKEDDVTGSGETLESVQVDKDAQVNNSGQMEEEGPGTLETASGSETERENAGGESESESGTAEGESGSEFGSSEGVPGSEPGSSEGESGSEPGSSESVPGNESAPENTAQSVTTQESAPPEDPFREVDEMVTAKEVTNLRSVPNTAQSTTIVTQLENGQTARRIGINETSGWSRLEYEGRILYAASRLLTTDLNYQPEPPQSADPDTVTTADGRTITFTPCDDTVSPKIEVNLRLEPSTSQGNDTIHVLLKYGENVHRTGYDEASGWSRVEYDGKVLYVVTSYIYVIETVDNE